MPPKDTRIVKRDLVYLIGLDERLAHEALLGRADMIGQYGQIRKIVINKDKPFGRGTSVGISFSAYVTFASSFEATLCILALDDFEVDGRSLKATFGMTKYCLSFTKGQACPNPDCLFLHALAQPEDSFEQVR